MSTGRATILLELDRVRGRVWNGNGTRIAQRTGWKRLLELTRSLSKSRAEYDVGYSVTEAAQAWDVRDYQSAGVLPLCDHARLVATVEWRLP